MTLVKTHILLPERTFNKRLPFYKKTLTVAAKNPLWQKHFQHNGFTLQPGLLSRNTWQNMPFFLKSDFARVKFLCRLKPIRRIQNNTYSFVLKTTSGTSYNSIMPLILHAIRQPPKIISKSESKKTVSIQGSFATALARVLSSIKNRKTNPEFDLLTVVPPIIDGMRDAIKSFDPNCIRTTPTILAYHAQIFADIKSLKNIILYGDFLTWAQHDLIKTLIPSCRIKAYYGLEEFNGAAARSCSYLAKRYGWNSYHPLGRPGHIIEIADIDENGVGEIVLTRLKPKSIALIRYRTGDMARAIEEKCECGAKFTLILEGRKDFDFVKCAGALITRTELERVMAYFNNSIENWRAEVGESLTMENNLIGELKIKIKPSASVKMISPEKIREISLYIRDNLFMTPTKTFSDLVREKRFLPLKIELVNNFPPSAKILKIIRSVYSEVRLQ